MRTVLAATLTAVAALTLAAPAEAAPAVRFVKVRYDSPGNDLPSSNAKVNAEWFRVKNTSRQAKRLAGWKVRDEAGYTFVFPSGFTLRPGAVVTVHTGRGTNTRTSLYWKQGYYVWNNDGDTATLKTGAGTVVGRCGWGDGSGVKAC